MSVVDYRSGLDDWSDTGRGRAGGWLAWGIYLGMSWTWCIGMFLPVILVRDYGVWAWLIFAIPNVIGAAAMGWVLRDHDSQAMVTAHSWAIEAFSLVTTTFQIFFALWMFYVLNAPNAAWACLILGLVVLRASRIDQNVQGIAVVVLFASLATMLFEGVEGALSLPPPRPVSALDLCALIPVSFFGFGLCPYLDATFHLARQRLGNDHARGAFSVGFGVFFLSMILFSLLYCALFIGGMPREARTGLIGHWVVQLGFTIGLHWYGIQREGERPKRATKWMRVGLSFALAAMLWSATVLGSRPLDGEFIYRCFMGFYGLIFPAYVWLCVIPGKGRIRPNRRQLLVLAAAVVIALPMFWMGFVDKKMGWLLPGVALVLLARLLVKRREPSEVTEDFAGPLAV